MLKLCPMRGTIFTYLQMNYKRDRKELVLYSDRVGLVLKTTDITYSYSAKPL